jgi:hypothetical protein
MKKIPFILLLVTMMLSLTSWKMESASLHPSPLTIHPSPLPSDTIKTTPAKRDTSVAFTDTLEEMSVQAKKGLAVEDAIKKSLNNGLTQPRQKSVSDIIGSKATDYIMHPFAWKERKKDKKHKKDKEALVKLEAAKTYEDELAEAIYRQLREDSIAAAKKKEAERK